MVNSDRFNIRWSRETGSGKRGKGPVNIGPSFCQREILRLNHNVNRSLCTCRFLFVDEPLRSESIYRTVKVRKKLRL